MLGDGTVEVNRRSPATYLNEDRFATTPVPAFAKPGAAPQWEVQDRTGRFIWHDHRMHWMAHTTPPQGHSKNVKTKIFDYRIPVQVGSRRTALTGTLYWVGSPSGFPVRGHGIADRHRAAGARRGGGRAPATAGPPRPG